MFQNAQLIILQPFPTLCCLFLNIFPVSSATRIGAAACGSRGLGFCRRAEADLASGERSPRTGEAKPAGGDTAKVDSLAVAKKPNKINGTP